MRACARVCVRACVRACARARVHNVHTYIYVAPSNDQKWSQRGLLPGWAINGFGWKFIVHNKNGDVHTCLTSDSGGTGSVSS